MGELEPAPGVSRVVVKVGSAVVAPNGRVDHGAIGRIADELADLVKGGAQPVLVSSGAVASGFRALGLDQMPTVIRQKQTAAAIGQPALMREYHERLATHGVSVAQVLLTADDLAHRERFLNARHTLEALLGAGVLPIVNENDSVAFDEIKVGDNDRLSALVASAIDADLLVLLSAAPGLIDHSTGRVIPRVRGVEEAREFVNHADSSGVGTGGMSTKLEAVAVAAQHGIPSHIVGGPTDTMPDPIVRAIRADGVGTRFEPLTPGGIAARKSWIAHAARPSGTIVIDAGAARALRERGASLLPGGILSVEGRFDAGAAVEITGDDGCRVARGLSSYGSAEIEQIKGARSDAVAGILGYAYADEVVHRDDLHLTGGTP